MGQQRRKTILHGLVATLWRYLEENAEFADYFGQASRRDASSLFQLPLNVSAAECPLVAIRLTRIVETWRTNVSKQFRVHLAVSIYLPYERQDEAIDAWTLVRRPLDDQLNARFGLSYVIDFALGETRFLPIVDLDPADQERGVLFKIETELVFDLDRNPRSAGLYI